MKKRAWINRNNNIEKRDEGRGVRVKRIAAKNGKNFYNLSSSLFSNPSSLAPNPGFAPKAKKPGFIFSQVRHALPQDALSEHETGNRRHNPVPLCGKI